MKNITFFYLLSSLLFSQKNIIDNNNLKQGYWELYYPKTENIICILIHFIHLYRDNITIGIILYSISCVVVVGF